MSVLGPARAKRAREVEHRHAGDAGTWQAIATQSFVPLSVTDLGPARFSARLQSATVHDISFTNLMVSPHVVERSGEQINEHDEPHYKLNFQLAGHGLLTQNGREARTGPGDLVLFNTNDPYTLVYDNDVQLLVVQFPHRLLSAPPMLLNQLTAQAISGDRGLARVARSYLSELAQNLTWIAGELGPRIAHNAVGLLTSMFLSELGVLTTSATHPHEQLLREIEEFVQDNIADPELGPEVIASAHFISTRHLHTIFKERGQTVSDWIRSLRLEYCRRDLLDPVHAHESVFRIAMRWGFVDPSHFSKVFRSAYGMSPRDFRLAATGLG